MNPYIDNNLIFRQLYDLDSSTYTYLLGDRESGEAILIDPVLENVDRDLTQVEDLGLTLTHVLETHVHADHVTGADEIRKRTGAKTVLGKNSGVSCADLLIDDDETISFGRFNLKAISTPGHTQGCTSYQLGKLVFTGDTLFVRGNGRTDFQGGSAEELYDSVHSKLFSLPEDTLVFPAHNYQGLTVTSIGEEKRLNPRLLLERDSFVDAMHKLNKPLPRKFKVAVPSNMQCGNPKRKSKRTGSQKVSA